MPVTPRPFLFSPLKPLLRALAALALLAAPALAQGPTLAQSEPLRADQAFQLSAVGAPDGALTLSWKIAPGTYLYRDSLKATRDGTPVPLTLPPGEDKDDPNFGRVSIFHHAVAATAAGLPAAGRIEVTFQGCAEDGICYPPVTRQVDLANRSVVAPPRTGALLPGTSAAGLTRAFPPADFGPAAKVSRTDRPLAASPTVPGGADPAPVLLPLPAHKTAGARATPNTSALDEGAPHPEAVEGGATGVGPANTGTLNATPLGAGLLSGSLPPLLAAFLGFGLLLAFTPCVFPMIPILSGILAGSGAPLSAGRNFRLSLSYVLAMAAAYGVLGLVAGWSGANLQAALQTPWALGLMAVVFVGLALSMFGLFDLALPAGPAGRLSGGAKGGSLAGAAMLGFASALVVGPCVTPPLAAALLYAAQTGDGARGGASLFMLGLGMGVPLLLAGTFGAKVLPRSGRWLEGVKTACGVLFLGVAIYLAARLLPAPLALALWGLLALGAGIFLGAFDPLDGQSPPSARLRKGAGLAGLVYGVTLLVGAAGGAGDPARPLAFLAGQPGAASAPAAEREARVTSLAGLDGALAQAVTRTGTQAGTQMGGRAGKTSRAVLVTFTAGWCTVCKSNEGVMGAPAARDLLARLPRIDADVTDYGPEARALMTRFDVIGPPTLFLLDAEGHELPGSRRIGAITEADLAALAAKARL